MLIAISVLPLEQSRQNKKVDGLLSCSVIIIGSLPAAKPRSRIITLITRSIVSQHRPAGKYAGAILRRAQVRRHFASVGRSCLRPDLNLLQKHG
jgi:hypothetical protein